METIFISIRSYNKVYRNTEFGVCVLFVKNKIYKVIFFEIKLRILKGCIVIEISVIFMSLIKGNHGGMFLDALSI